MLSKTIIAWNAQNLSAEGVNELIKGHRNKTTKSKKVERDINGKPIRKKMTEEEGRASLAEWHRLKNAISRGFRPA